MKRILYLTYYFRPDLCAGSFRNSPLAETLAKEAAKSGVSVDVYTTIPNRYQRFDHPYEPVETLGNLTIYRLEVPRHQSGQLDQMRSFTTYYRQVMSSTREKEVDLVFASSSRFFTSWLGYRMARKKNVPLYVDVRDIFSETLRDLSGNPITRSIGSRLVHLLEKRVYNYSSHINLISEGFLPSFDSYPKEKITTYTHGIDPAFTNLPQNNFVNEENFNKKIEILYAGNIGHAQALHEILPDIAKALKETHRFTVIGDGSAREILKKVCEQQKLFNVNILDPVQRETLVSHYKDADIFFLNLKDIGVFNKVLPSKLFEYGAAGRPIAAGVAGYAKEFIKQHFPESNVFTPGDPDDAIRVIKEISEKDHIAKKPDRNHFIKQFSRTEIDHEIAKSIMNTLFEAPK